MNEKLLPCPFCGGEVIIEYLQGFGMDSGNWINCTQCNHALVFGDKAGIEYWNHRVYPPEVMEILRNAEIALEVVKKREP